MIGFIIKVIQVLRLVGIKLVKHKLHLRSIKPKVIAPVSFFEMNVPIRVLGSGGETADFVLDQFVNGQSFLENINFDAAEVIIDPNHDVVSKNNEVLSDPSPNLLEISFKLFPNPASNVVYIQKPRAVSIYHIQIFDMLGKLIDEQNSKEKINVSDLSPGASFY